MIEIKKATREHDEEIKKLVMAILDEFQMDELKTKLGDLRDLDTSYFHANGAFLIALEKEELIGTVAIENFETVAPKRARLRRFYADRAHRHKGIGKELLIVALSEAKKLGYADIVCGSEMQFEQAHRVYRAAGFEEYKRDEKCVYFKRILR